jgi:hypothetical protein
VKRAGYTRWRDARAVANLPKDADVGDAKALPSNIMASMVGHCVVHWSIARTQDDMKCWRMYS